MMSKICRFTHGISISVTSTGFRLSGMQNGSPVDDRFTMREAPIDELVNLDEGRVHAMLANGAIYTIDVNDQTGFTVSKISA
jgi:hypothetical protein